MLDDTRYSDPLTAQSDRFRDILRRLTAIERVITTPGPVPIGGWIYLYGDVPSGWLQLNGSTVLADDWPRLAKINPAWVSGSFMTLPSQPNAGLSIPVMRGK